jgi:hypothetical protein
MHERILQLEDRQDWQGPSDEQVERVLRKILAERFSDGTMHEVQHPDIRRERDYFVEDPRKQPAPRPVLIDPAALFVDPEAVPSKAYADTLNMLEGRLHDFPDATHKMHVVEGPRDGKLNYNMGQVNGIGHV